MSVISQEKDERCGASESSVVEETDHTGLSEVYKRHGTVDLLPMPSGDPQDPLNWPSWRKNVLLWLVAFHAMQGPFGASMIIPAFEDLSGDFGVTLDRIAYLVSVEILFLGVMPVFWSPISERIGRRPVYLISALVSSACALAGAYCHSYGTLMTTRVFQATFMAPAQSLGACTVSEMFFAHQKGRKMGVWVLLVTIGSVVGPLTTGYLIQNKGWHAAFYLLAAIHLGLFFAHLVFGPETMYPNRVAAGQVDSEMPSTQSQWKDQYLTFRVYDRRPFRWQEIWRPFTMATRPIVLLSALGIALPFAYTGVTLTIFVPQIFGKVFHLSPGQISLQFIALLIGAVLGEQLAGLGSDLLVNWRTKLAGGLRVPEYRLPLAYPGFVLSIVGIIIWGVQLQNATPGVWNVTPDVGAAIAMFGAQLVTTVCTTYAIESYQADTAHVSAILTVIRQVYAFIAPFYLPVPFESWGDGAAAGLFGSLITISALMIVACHIWGSRWRKA